jgi:hypothetical protein
MAPELTLPESITALAPKVPVNDHTYPVAAALVIFCLVSVVTGVKAGAIKRYILDPQSTTDIGTIVMDAGAAGGNKLVFDNLTERVSLLPQEDEV